MIESGTDAIPPTEQMPAADEAAASEFIGGALLVVLGVGALYLGSDYRMGTSFNMGAGYFPRLVAGGLLLLGSLLLLKGWRAGLRALPTMPVRPTAAIIGAVLVFGYLVESFGLLLTSALSVVIASLGVTSQSFGRTVVVALVLASLASLIFGVFLSLPLPVWPRSWIF